MTWSYVNQLKIIIPWMSNLNSFCPKFVSTSAPEHPKLIEGKNLSSPSKRISSILIPIRVKKHNWNVSPASVIFFKPQPTVSPVLYLSQEATHWVLLLWKIPPSSPWYPTAYTKPPQRILILHSTSRGQHCWSTRTWKLIFETTPEIDITTM